MSAEIDAPKAAPEISHPEPEAEPGTNQHAGDSPGSTRWHSPDDDHPGQPCRGRDRQLVNHAEPQAAAKAEADQDADLEI